MPPNRSSNEFLIRAVLFLILVVALDLWWGRHRGSPPWSTGFTATVAAAIAAAFAWLDKLADDEEKKQVRGATLGVIRTVFSVRVLAVGYVLFAVLGLSYSSVTVLSDSASEKNEISLSPVDDTQQEQALSLGPDTRLVRFPVHSGPFGRPFLLRAQGYLPRTFDVYPVTGLTVRLERDLRVSPSVLFRPPTEAMAELEGGGTFVVRAAIGGEQKEIASQNGSRSSFLVGRAQAIPQDWWSLWSIELEGDLSLMDADVRRRILSRTLLEWRRPAVLSPSVALEPGMQLAAEACSPGGGRMASALITVSSEALIDVRMTPPKETESCESSPGH
jgi:hypothetical protein